MDENVGFIKLYWFSVQWKGIRVLKHKVKITTELSKALCTLLIPGIKNNVGTLTKLLVSCSRLEDGWRQSSTQLQFCKLTWNSLGTHFHLLQKSVFPNDNKFVHFVTFHRALHTYTILRTPNLSVIRSSNLNVSWKQWAPKIKSQLKSC